MTSLLVRFVFLRRCGDLRQELSPHYLKLELFSFILRTDEILRLRLVKIGRRLAVAYCTGTSTHTVMCCCLAAKTQSLLNIKGSVNIRRPSR